MNRIKMAFCFSVTNALDTCSFLLSLVHNRCASVSGKMIAFPLRTYFAQCISRTEDGAIDSGSGETSVPALSVKDGWIIIGPPCVAMWLRFSVFDSLVGANNGSVNDGEIGVASWSRGGSRSRV